MSAANAAYQGGATRIELCSAMHVDGLTPTTNQIVAARQGFPKAGLIAMLRPGPGDFTYSDRDLFILLDRIPDLHRAGADGISFGFLNDVDQIDLAATARLVAICGKLDMTTTFHRAFDATPDTNTSLDSLIEAGVDRVLTSGTPWGTPGRAIDALDRLSTTIDRAHNRIEVIIAGGVSAETIPTILSGVPQADRFSLHAYSGTLVDGRPSLEAVQSLVDAANA